MRRACAALTPLSRASPLFVQVLELPIRVYTRNGERSGVAHANAHCMMLCARALHSPCLGIALTYAGSGSTLRHFAAMTLCRFLVQVRSRLRRVRASVRST